MICEKQAKRYCRDSLALIENYDKAINDTTQTWHCHHRDEVKVLPSGIIVIRSTQDLKDAGRYFDCPANELIFLTKSEHRKLHSTNKSESHRMKIAEAHKNMSDEARKRRSAAVSGTKNPMYGRTGKNSPMYGKTGPNKGRKFSDETKKKLSEIRKGRHWKLVDGKRVYY